MLGGASPRAPWHSLPAAKQARWHVQAMAPILPNSRAAFRMSAVVGTPDDIGAYDFPSHARWSFIGRLTLRQTAELMAAAGAVVANDSGLAHIAAAVGTPTVMIFGPTPSRTLGRFPPHVSALSLAMECQPCWYTAPLRACGRRVDCLQRFPAERVREELISIGQIERTQ